jgi:hypothetical protein
MGKVYKYLPMAYYKTIYDIGYEKYYQYGKRYILFDLDNTLATYDQAICSDEVLKLIEKVRSLGYTILIISNNTKERVDKFIEPINCLSVPRALKPLKKGFKKALKLLEITDVSEIMLVGDQIMTDVYGARKLEIDTILVKPLKKANENWYTKFNRAREQRLYKRIKKKYPHVYEELKELIN